MTEVTKLLKSASELRFPAHLAHLVLGNSTEWIFDIRRLDRAQKGGFHYPYWILGRRKVNKCTEMDENKVECGKIP